MAVREIIHLPDSRLREKSEPVTTFDSELKKLIQDLKDTLTHAKGLGLAAVQIAVHKRVLVLDLGDLDDSETFKEGDEDDEKRLSQKKKISKFEVFINPVILKSEGEIEYEEGCLSVPGVYSIIQRKEALVLEFQDETGAKKTVETHGLKSIALQHEMDHLDGVVFTDRLGPMQKMRILNQYNKLQKLKKQEVL